ncbi:hypothetical protein BO78DRAFT_453094 [Aspergillus sclerotiicarbonarius CBS 121057]|uniref:Uncharacterized protein n=1 Tax=Aspergillus sclerotiicarbonarius (strain CBS 121057 / IBT 28362) TaxID=1448318 RepID=A0A319EPU4_ASPSB|nr:hypothetical protein BO78DRAFT_453094 [Aspergillus sclerotiicarbonarius CBS 121057]
MAAHASNQFYNTNGRSNGRRPPYNPNHHHHNHHNHHNKPAHRRAHDGDITMVDVFLKPQHKQRPNPHQNTTSSSCFIAKRQAPQNKRGPPHPPQQRAHHTDIGMSNTSYQPSYQRRQPPQPSQHNNGRQWNQRRPRDKDGDIIMSNTSFLPSNQRRSILKNTSSTTNNRPQKQGQQKQQHSVHFIDADGDIIMSDL